MKVIKSDPLAPISSHVGWAFPDTEEGIYSAAQQGATHFWANTILFTSHLLQISPELTPVASEIYVVGQPPGLAENFDDKAYLNDKLRELGGYTLPKSWLVSPKNISEIINHIDRYPIVGKPVRRRGSHGVKVCHDKGQLQQHVQTLLRESPFIMLEKFLSGEEATITVMPPAIEHSQHWSMLTVTRLNYAEGIAPYNGVVAVTSNSRVISQSELKDPGYRKVMRECESVAALIRATAPVRVYVRQFVEGSDFALFDINMKPVRHRFRPVALMRGSRSIEHDRSRPTRTPRSGESHCYCCVCDWVGQRHFTGQYPERSAAVECI